MITPPTPRARSRNKSSGPQPCNNHFLSATLERNSHVPNPSLPEWELLPEHATGQLLFLAGLDLSVHQRLQSLTVLAASSRAEVGAPGCRSPPTFLQPTQGTSELPTDPGHEE